MHVKRYGLSMSDHEVEPLDTPHLPQTERPAGDVSERLFTKSPLVPAPKP